jgi:ribosomal protein S18 acetylase RimI-like enzyme
MRGEVSYEHARESDIPSVAEVFATSIDDLDKKHGFFEEPTPTSPSPQYAFWLKRHPGAFLVAKDEGEVVGYAFSFVRGTLWFLADLFILPSYQGRGIGRELIRRTLGSWEGTKIDNKALITPAFNRSSVSLYMRYGMLPRQPVYVATAPVEKLKRRVSGKKGKALEVEEVDRRSLPLLDRVHRSSMGFPAGWHNEYFIDVLGMRCLLFRKNGRAEGYAFVRKDGRVGPLVVRSRSSFAPAFESSLKLACEGEGKEVLIFFPGTNLGAVERGIALGFEIVYPLLFLSQIGMGDFQNYLFYSPGLM